MIAPASALPTISVPVTIDGTTEPGVEIDGGDQAFDGLILGAGSGGSVITGLTIANFNGAGIHIESSNDSITDNQVGTDPAGTGAGPGNYVGILVNAANGGTGVRIGGTTAAAANTIGFNDTAGVQIIGTSPDDDAGAVVEGNRIGTNAAGTQNLGNGTAIQVFNASDNTIGGSASGAANVIGFSKTVGVAILSGAGNTILSNTYDATNGSLSTPSVAASDIGVGVGANGNLAPPQLLSASLSPGNGTLSIALASPVAAATSLDVYLLVPAPSERKFLGDASIAAGGSSASLTVSGVATGMQIVATQTVVADGTSAFSAPLSVAPATTVTNTNDSGPGSLRAAIAAAGSGGLITFDIPTTPAVIDLQSTLAITVPLTIDGTSELTSQKTPAIVLQKAPGSGSFAALDLKSGSGGSTIKGLEVSGFGGAGILVESAGNTIGGTAAGAGNVVVSGTSAGISISGAGNVVEGNLIGTDAAGDHLGNAQGLVIASASNNTIGGTAAGAGNSIAFNGSGSTPGAVSVDTGTGNTILQDLIYDNTGTTFANSGISLVNANDSSILSAPVISGVATSGGESTILTLNVAGMAAGTYLLDAFSSAPAMRPAPRGSTPTFIWPRCR